MIRKPTSVVTWAGWVFSVICKATIPFGYMQSPLKLTKGDPKGVRCFGSNFICWNAIMYITSAKLPLSTKTLQVLYPSIFSIITRGSSCGYLTPLASRLGRKQCHPLQCDDVWLLSALYEHYWLAIGLPFSKTCMTPLRPVLQWLSLFLL